MCESGTDLRAKAVANKEPYARVFVSVCACSLLQAQGVETQADKVGWRAVTSPYNIIGQGYER